MPDISDEPDKVEWVEEARHTKAYRPQFEYRRLFQVHWSKVGFYMRYATI